LVILDPSQPDPDEHINWHGHLHDHIPYLGESRRGLHEADPVG